MLQPVSQLGSQGVIYGVSFLWLEITQKCNLTCSHCYADSDPQGELYGTMSFDDWCRVIDEAAEMGCRQIQFIGGEPTMHPRLDDLIDRANHRGYELIEVFTNATRLSKQLIGCFQRNGVHVATSFYSEDEVVHEKITQGKGSWQQTVVGIQNSLLAGLHVRVGVIETEHNHGHGPRAIEYVKGLGVADVGFDRARGVGRGQVVRLTGAGERYEELCGQCWKGKLCVTSTGTCYPCVMSRGTDLGTVKSGLTEVINSVGLARFREKMRQIDQDRSIVTNCEPNCFPGLTGPCNPSFPCQPNNPPPGPCAPDAQPCYPGPH